MVKSYKPPLVAWLACAGATMLLGLLAYGSDRVQRFDADLLEWVASPTTEEAGAFVRAVVRLGDAPFIVLGTAIACGIALWRRRPLDAAAVLTLVAGASLTTEVLKLLVSHPRLQPALAHGEMSSNSFPSGHATAAASLAIAFAIVVPRSWRPLTVVLGICFAALIDTAVLILCLHYPSDVLGGTLVAAGWGFAVLAVLRYAETPPPQHSLSPPAAYPSR